MTKKTTKSSKKPRSRKVLEFPNRGVRPSPGAAARKLSELIREMALQLLEKPDAIPSEPALVVALMLAGIAWNAANGDSEVLASQREVFEHIDWGDVVPWAELRSDDIDQLVAELVAYKRKHYPEDPRRIMATELTPEGEVRVHWSEPDKVVTAAFGTTASKPKGARTKAKAARAKSKGGKVRRSRPIASKLVKKMKRYVNGKVVDLEAFQLGKENVAELYKTVASREELASYHPAQAIYIYAQNQVSVMSEQLTTLKEMERFVSLIGEAEDEYMPGGPPMSPLTTSFFTSWAFFDACVGLGEETIATTVMRWDVSWGCRKSWCG